MIANEHDVWHGEFIEDSLLPFKLFCHSKVGKVSAMYHEVYVLAGVDVRHLVFRFIVPPLRIADKGEAYLRLSFGVLLYSRHVAGVDISVAINVPVVGMDVYEVAGGA